MTLDDILKNINGTLIVQHVIEPGKSYYEALLRRTKYNARGTNIQDSLNKLLKKIEDDHQKRINGN